MVKMASAETWSSAPEAPEPLSFSEAELSTEPLRAESRSWSEVQNNPERREAHKQDAQDGEDEANSDEEATGPRPRRTS